MKKFNDISIRTTENIGQTVQRLRHLAGLSQAVLAEKTGLTQSLISRVEKGVQNTEMATFILILNALNVDLVVKNRKSTNNLLAGFYE